MRLVIGLFLFSCDPVPGTGDRWRRGTLTGSGAPRRAARPCAAPADNE